MDRKSSHKKKFEFVFNFVDWLYVVQFQESSWVKMIVFEILKVNHSEQFFD